MPADLTPLRSRHTGDIYHFTKLSHLPFSFEAWARVIPEGEGKGRWTRFIGVRMNNGLLAKRIHIAWPISSGHIHAFGFISRDVTKRAKGKRIESLTG